LSNLLKRTAVGLLFVIIMIGSILIVWWTWFLLALLIVVGISIEMSALLKGLGIKISVYYLTVSAILFFFAVCIFLLFQRLSLISILLFGLGLFIHFINRWKTKESFRNGVFILAASLYISTPMGLSVVTALINNDVSLGSGIVWFPEAYRPVMLLSIFILIWTNDSFAYLTGVNFGKHKICPKVSPKKSWEGFFGGSIFTLLMAFVLHRFWGEMELVYWFGLAVIVSVFGTTGDFIQSQLKRLAGVKDSGKLLPGHGGLFDRFDSFLFIMPFSAFYYLILQSAAKL
jgi:phosphatidate cytidylyltransferase